MAIFSPLSDQDTILFAKRLSILLKSGVPLLDALRMLKKQAPSAAAGKIFGAIAAEVENGQFLSTSLGGRKKIFGDFAVQIVRVGELSGTLQENLDYLAEELRKRRELKRKMIGALIYPAFIMGATIIIASLLTIFIFPKILPVFRSFKFDLPFTTRTLIFISSVLVHDGAFMLAGIGALAAGLYALTRNRKARYAIDRLILKVPVFGRLAQNYHMANFTRTLGLLLKSQIMIVEATGITAETVRNAVYKKELDILKDYVAKGGKISAYLEQKPRLFPAMVPQMVAVGETTGNLSETLIYISEMYENEIETLTKNLSTTLEPVLMIVMGAIVGFIAISIITPIYEITQHLQP